MYLCSSCIKEKCLKKFLLEKETIISKCHLCNKSQPCVDCGNKEFSSLFKAMFRYYYSQWEYDGHLGGTSFENLFRKDNYLLNYDPNILEENIEDIVLELLEPVYEKYEEGISLFSGYDENGQPYMPLQAIKDQYSNFLKHIEGELKSKNHFRLEKLVSQRINDIEKYIESEIRAKSEYFRARIGFESKCAIYSDDGWSVDYHYNPYRSESINAPLPVRAQAGRMNRMGVSFLYLSTDRETALAEIRPHPGQYISVGKFIVSQDLRIADFRSMDIYKFYHTDKELDQFVLIKSIDHLFSMPVPPNELNRYTITQLFADVIRQIGYDGIAFKSSVGSGSNLTVFDRDHFKYTDDDHAVVAIKSLNYQLTDMPIINPHMKEDYLYEVDGETGEAKY